MDTSQYGQFANIVAIAAALIAVFGVLLLKMLGGIKRWTWLSADSPSFLVAAGARVLAVALMAVTYITIDSLNYGWFGIAAIVSGVLGFISVAKFDHLRKLHVVSIPIVNSDGSQLQDNRGVQLFKNIVIGAEDQLRPEATAAFKNARERGGISLIKFMSGYGSSPNDPEALWERSVLAKIGNKLITSLMYVILLAVMTIFWAALIIEVAIPPG